MSLGCKTPADLIKAMADNDIRHVDFRFTDPRGKWQHTTQYHTTVDEDLLTDGVMFDGSSIDGFARINESDMYLKPDFNTFTILPWRKKEGNRNK